MPELDNSKSAFTFQFAASTVDFDKIIKLIELAEGSLVPN
jgi:hypothetical protein